MNLVIANHISDKVIDDVIDNLSRTYKGLIGDVGSLKKKRSLTPDVLKVNWWILTLYWRKPYRNFSQFLLTKGQSKTFVVSRRKLEIGYYFYQFSLHAQGSSQRLDSLSESDSHSMLGDSFSQGGPSPISTPSFAKRKSVQDSRKLRPKSVVDNGEGYGPGERQQSFQIIFKQGFLMVQFNALVLCCTDWHSHPSKVYGINFVKV